MLACLILPLSGCRTPLVQTTIINQGTTEVRNVELDYPSASFGLASLQPGGHFSYRFKIDGSGHLQLHYVDSAKHDHSKTGPYVAQGQQGTLQINIGDSGSVWQMQLKPTVQAPKE